MKIAENLKRLRRARDLTQEELAAYIGVSPQAISKWENGTGLPDITFVPTIAGFFGVSTDELFGMDSLRSEENLYNAFKLANELTAAGDIGGAIEHYERALKISPENAALLAGLGQTLALSSDDPADLARAVELCERALRSSPGEKVRATIRASLCYINAQASEPDKAADMARTLPHFWESREFNLPELLPPTEREKYLHEKIPVILSVICKLIDGARSSRENLSSLVLGFPERGDAQNNAIIFDKIAEFLGIS
jgi:transcriptional regulator with XRE-family HTH domain